MTKKNVVAVVTDKSGKKHYIPDLWDVKRKRCSYSNDKTGLPSVNQLPGDINHLYDGSIPTALKEYFPLCSGTCHGDCPGCYAKKVTRNFEPFIKWAMNTIEAKTDPERFWHLVEKELYGNPIVIYRVVRIHDGGDFFNKDYFETGVNMIKRHMDTTSFGSYTKEADIVLGYGIDNLPSNFILSCSPWEGFCEPIGDLPQFIYDDGTNPELAALPHCPAVAKNGKRTGVQCKDCLHCYKAKRGDRWCVYAHK